MNRPNIGPQPADAIVLRGTLQIETAMKALRITGLQPDFQTDLAEELDHAREAEESVEKSGMTFGYSFTRGGDDIEELRADLLRSLNEAASDDTEDQELAMAAGSLKSVLELK